MSRNIRSKRTKSEILDAAWEAVARRGADASLAEIAERARISRQAVHLHFGTRGGLLVALVRRADERFAIAEEFERAFQVRSPKSRLDRTLRAWFAFVVKIKPVARELVRLRDTDTDADAAWSDRMAELRSWFRTLVRSLDDDGALAPGWRVDEAADYLWASSSLQVWNLFTDDRGWSNTRTEKTLRKTIADSLLA